MPRWNNHQRRMNLLTFEGAPRNCPIGGPQSDHGLGMILGSQLSFRLSGCSFPAGLLQNLCRMSKNLCQAASLMSSQLPSFSKTQTAKQSCSTRNSMELSFCATFISVVSCSCSCKIQWTHHKTEYQKHVPDLEETWGAKSKCYFDYLKQVHTTMGGHVRSLQQLSAWHS